MQSTESLDGREVTILRILSRGRAWLDASDHRLRRWVDERVVSDTTLPEPGVVRRIECEYANSAFGILVPQRVLSEFYRKSGKKNGPQLLRLAVRLTNTYSDFKRFDVFTVIDIRLPGTKEQ